ncbi:MAG: helix-turn-helix domain-containing protein [Candidatus Aerophobetes bacterium]|nr:helix-turn-helix domain-containing protein [Candidatus Aerophobetes bacterium]
MKKEERRKYRRLTTFLQRKLMIETYLETHNITQSCRKSRVAINTFRRWYPRYLEGGLEGIKKPKTHTNKQLGRIEEKYKNRIIELKKKHPKWGRRTIASIIRNENNGKRIISPSGVQKILEKADLWKKEKKK